VLLHQLVPKLVCHVHCLTCVYGQMGLACTSMCTHIPFCTAASAWPVVAGYGLTQLVLSVMHAVAQEAAWLQALANFLTPVKMKMVAPLAVGAPRESSLAGLLSVKPTLVVAPAECFSHRTCPEPIVRDGPDVPPENVNRLKVLTDPGSL
jgi:hypothetical protein